MTRQKGKDALTIALTETAAKIHDFMAQTGKEGYGLRMRVAGGGCQDCNPIGNR